MSGVDYLLKKSLNFERTHQLILIDLLIEPEFRKALLGSIGIWTKNPFGNTIEDYFICISQLTRKKIGSTFKDLPAGKATAK